eukprot:g1024.t1
MQLPQLIFLMVCIFTAATEGVIPTTEIAPGVDLPFITLGGINTTLQPDYPDPSNYSLWLELGGRGFDSAWEYGTQRAVARAVRESLIPRSEIFITTKIPGSLHGGCCGCPGASPAGQCLIKCHGVCFPASGHYTAANATAYIARDLELLSNGEVDDDAYIDLLLLHEPCDTLAPYPYNASAETSAIYGAMEAALRSEDPRFKGKIKAIGVSNFNAEMLRLLAKTNPDTPPAVNQCRMTVGGYDAETHQYCKDHGIQYQAYSVLHGKGTTAAPVLAAAAAHHVSPQDVMERWVTQLGVPFVTASTSRKYDLEDMGIFDFNLTDAEMDAITRFDPSK